MPQTAHTADLLGRPDTDQYVETAVELLAVRQDHLVAQTLPARGGQADQAAVGVERRTTLCGHPDRHITAGRVTLGQQHLPRPERAEDEAGGRHPGRALRARQCHQCHQLSPSLRGTSGFVAGDSFTSTSVFAAAAAATWVAFSVGTSTVTFRVVLAFVFASVMAPALAVTSAALTRVIGAVPSWFAVGTRTTWTMSPTSSPSDGARPPSKLTPTSAPPDGMGASLPLVKLSGVTNWSLYSQVVV